MKLTSHIQDDTGFVNIWKTRILDLKGIVVISFYRVNIVLERGRKFPKASLFISIRLGTWLAHSAASIKRG